MSEVKRSFRTVVENQPRIAEKIKLFWGEQEFTDLVQNLIYDSRDGMRQGFPVEVMSALITLQYWHDHHFPQHAKPSGKSWALSSRPHSQAPLPQAMARGQQPAY